MVLHLGTLIDCQRERQTNLTERQMKSQEDSDDVFSEISKTVDSEMEKINKKFKVAL